MNEIKARQILIIAPLTPPYTGNALPIKYIYDRYSSDNKITLINLDKGSLISGYFSFFRFFQIINVLLKVIKHRWNKDIIYLTIAESKFGNIRDLLIYSLILGMHSQTVIHLLGGNSMKALLSNKKSGLFWLNKLFISKLGAVIVEGQFQADFFKNVIDSKRIFIVPNFAQEFLFTTKDQIEKKFENTGIIKVLFLSNLLFGKGHYELFMAFRELNNSEKERIEISFAGSFENEIEKERFINLISPYSQLRYIGHVSGVEKELIFKKSHVFCLPTYYPFEGQPFVIVESYAAGCAVITTNHSGIPFIFRDNYNGIMVKKESVESLFSVLRSIINNEYPLKAFALNNFNDATNYYTDSVYLQNVKNVFKSILEK